ncbi:DUF3016 domain-containing protein [Thalassotalea euphylliae]|uniref:DUF3016 domain-containing protein n=1 Tax=Thalassotalea euphylliae TaxID=1655234 RepID=A0A3E0TWS1_9GAMM|nr:DUF3016 domain-containing protein [Thalassotalea euphylliae]REL28382.1 DUF3016 domain-containing protein [Thalassotalea euphylliae]
MKLLSYSLVAILLSVFSLTTANAGTVSVEWTNPDDYRDIRPTNESRKRFKERTFKDLEQFVTKLAAELPQGYELKLNVTNLDLAGNVEFGRTQQIRIVRQIHFPSIEFDYQLIDGNSQAVASEQVSLKDMNFLHHIKSNLLSKSLGYEKRMLKEWFNKTFAEQIQKT